MLIYTAFGVLDIVADLEADEYAIPNNDLIVFAPLMTTLTELEKRGAAFGTFTVVSDSPTLYKAMCTRTSLKAAISSVVDEIDYDDLLHGAHSHGLQGLYAKLRDTFLRHYLSARDMLRGR